MGGSKGQSSQQTNQAQTYTPNPQGASAIQGALTQGQQAAATPFQQGVAPVAGFTPDQLAAFGSVRSAQGMAQPYYNQGQGYLDQSTHPDISQFFNPYAGAVMGNMQDLFGQQASQNSGKLTQAAGGVGADRIAVGEQELAKQQGQVAGQTMAQLYAPSLSAAQQQQQMLQNAGYGVAALGQQAQNSVFSGASQQLGTGGLQQQLSQAQMNAPYQWDLARLAYPFQTAQFNAGITGSLAPGLGGTTTGQGNTQNTPAQPSIWSQLLGAGTAAAGIYGGFNGGSNGGVGYQTSTGNYNGMTNEQQDALQDSGFNLPSARGGRINPYAEGGSVSDEPIDISAHSIIPQEQLQTIKPNVPQLNLNPAPAQGGSSGGGAGDALKMGMDVAKMAMMFANRGGRINPYAQGGEVFARGGSSKDFADITNGDPGWSDPDVGPGYAMPPQPTSDVGARGAWDTWPSENPSWKSRSIAPVASSDVPMPRARPAMADAPIRAADDAGPMKFTNDATPSVFPYAPPAAGAGASPPSGPAPAAESMNPFSQDAGDLGTRVSDYQKSPWAALTAAGLGMMAGTSPFAGVNIGQGGLQGMKALETQREAAQKDTTIAQSARRLALEAKSHEDLYNRETISQKQAREQADRPYRELTKAEQETSDNKNFGWQQNDDGTISYVKGGPHDPETLRAQAEAKLSGGITDQAVEVMARQGAAGDQSWSKNIGRGAQSGRTLERVRNRMADILTNEQGKTPTQAAEFISNAQKEWSASQIAANAGARARGTRIANLDMILEVADAAVPAALEASKKVNRTGWVPLNQIIQKGQVMTSDADLNDFGIANLQLAEGWARAMNPTGVMRESDRDKALSYLGTATSQETYERAVRQIQKQITREKDAISKGHSPKDFNTSAIGDMPSPQAIEMLASDPKKYRDDFEKRYGKGSADRFGG